MTDDQPNEKKPEPEGDPADENPNEAAVGAKGDGDETEDRRRPPRRPYNFVGPIIPPMRLPFLDDLFKQQRNLVPHGRLEPRG